MSLDLVHDSRDNSGSRKATAQKDSSLLLQELVVGPAVDVSLARSTSFPSITKEESLVVCFVGTETVCPL